MRLFRFNDLPIRRKLILIIVTVSAVALLLARAGMAVYEFSHFRNSLARERSAEAQIVAEQVGAALMFSDQRAALRALRAFRGQPGIVNVGLFTTDGKIFAEFNPDQTPYSFSLSDAPGYRFENGHLLVFEEVRFGPEKIGMIALRSDLREQREWLKASAGVAAVALLAALLASLILSVKMQRAVSAPVLELANVAHRVTREKNYSLRAHKHGGDEIGLLTEEFNQMLAQIERRDAALRESEERFRQLAESIREVFWLTDIDGNTIYYISPGFEIVWGFSCETLYSSPNLWLEAVHSEDRARVQENAAMRKTSGDYDVEYRIVRPDGTTRWIHDRAFPVRDAGGKVYRIAGIAEDITERKRAEETLRRTEELYRQAITGAGAVPYARDYKTRSYLFMGEGIEKLLGYSQSEICGNLWRRIIKESVMLGEGAGLTIEEAEQRVVEGKIKMWQCDLHVIALDGASRWISDVAVQNVNEAGELVGSMGILQDITERKLAEKQNAAFLSLASRLSACSTQEEAAANILETASELIGWDCGFVHLYDWERDLILPILTFDLIDGKRTVIPSVEFKKPSPLTRWIMKNGGVLIDPSAREQLPFRLVPFGDKKNVSSSMMYVPVHQSRNMVGVLSIQRYSNQNYTGSDLNLLRALADHCGGALQRIKAARDLLEAEAKFRTIFEGATEGIFQTTPPGEYVRGNPALARMFGFQAFEEMRSCVTDIEQQTYVLPERRREMRRTLETQGEIRGFEAERYRRDGSRFWISINARVVRDDAGQVLYYEGTARDVTSRRHLERQLIEISDREQSRLGQDLHDGLCQQLVRTAFAANLLEQDLAAHPAAPIGQAKKVSALIDDAITQARQLARGLYPVKLEIEGLAAVLQELAIHIHTAYNVPCEFESNERGSIEDYAVATHLYRIAQEAAVNSAKHARATKIEIQLRCQTSELVLTVSDDGVGISSGTNDGGMGVHIMHYRAGMIGASFKIGPRPGGGTIVSCVLEHKSGRKLKPQKFYGNHF